MTCTLLSRVICYFRGLINAAGGFPMALGDEEKPVVLMLQIYTMSKAYYTAPSAWPQRAPSATLDVFKTLPRWPRPIIVVNDPPLPRDTVIPYVFFYVQCTWRWVGPSCYCDGDVSTVELL